MKLIMLDNDECDIDEFELHEKTKSSYGYNLNLKKDQERLIADISYTMHAFKKTEGVDDDGDDGDDEPEDPKESPAKKSKKKTEKNPPKNAVVH